MRFCLLIIVVMVSVASGYAQFGSPITTSYRAPGGQHVPYTSYIPSPRYNNGNSNISAKYDFHFVLKNDSTFNATTRINITNDEDNSITVKIRKVKTTFFPEDTKSISRTTYDGKLLTGIPADSCWLFKTVTGKINTYSYLAEPGFDFVIAIQDGDKGKIVPLTKENIKQMITGTEDPKIDKWIENKKFAKAIERYNAK